ncbi:MAG: SAM-dependent DNA methyltransferase [Caldilineaceae bacterium SB0665_bin_21]|nr:SAM-dependent DNA methyltransferase [Caldilineaceae bacterium SB0665_bin_21]MYA05937.1 SAM-dependent DNA methyltransferase [Caldilineaceae bacterium SB0664_bin_22]MYC61660.1 SAM-dependent DNA methyltransferase [Caldilineaceae bacterium SB0661_bin_34]
MNKSVSGQEVRRLAVQAELDAAKNQVERNRMGQFATPTELAVEMLRYAKTELDPTSAVRFIDPAIGTGSFYSALLRVFPGERVTDAVGYEIDPHYGQPAARLWKETALDLRLEDFTLAPVPAEGEKFNLLICNPPYVRHHHIASPLKRQLKALAWQGGGIEVNGLSGLYCYFLGLAHPWMADGGLAGWLIPSEFMDVNYGASVKRYLLDQVTLLHIHRFDPNEVQFRDALVSSAVVWFSKQAPPPGHRVRMTFGGSQLKPALERWVPADTLRDDPKWTRYPQKESRARLRLPVLADFFTIKRGLVTGSNSYFILPAEEIECRSLPTEVFQPILPSPRYLPADEILADASGNPRLERRLFLLSCRLKEEVVKERYPKLWDYLLEGREKGIPDGYTCRNRSPWYAQEHRPATPFLCTYIGRSDKKGGRPFRFFLNHSNATAPNVYLMLYPRRGLDQALTVSPRLKFRIWNLLNSIDPGQMLSEGRVYGGGMHKLEPKELGRVPTPALAEFLLPWVDVEGQQLELFGSASP